MADLPNTMAMDYGRHTLGDGEKCCEAHKDNAWVERKEIQDELDVKIMDFFDLKELPEWWKKDHKIKAERKPRCMVTSFIMKEHERQADAFVKGMERHEEDTLVRHNGRIKDDEKNNSNNNG
eukprot:270245_1